jgi:hypothetical protein
MFVTTETVHEPHFVIGPVFALTEIKSGFFTNLKRPEMAFEELLPILEAEAAKRNAHGIIGARFSFVDSTITSTFAKILSSSNAHAIYVFGSGTAVQLYRYLQAPDQINQDASYRLSLVTPIDVQLRATGADPTQGLTRMTYGNLEYWPLPDGKVRANTPKGWVDFLSLAALKEYKGVK